jgi:hypothetical protein
VRPSGTSDNEDERFKSIRYAALAQLVEQYFRKVEVPGSNPGSGSKNAPRARGAFLFAFILANPGQNMKNMLKSTQLSDAR